MLHANLRRPVIRNPLARQPVTVPVVTWLRRARCRERETCRLPRTALLARRHGRRGAVIVLVSVLMVVLLGFVALTVDIGHLLALSAEMQRTVDASALAGASALEDTEGEVLARAERFAGLNFVNGTGLSPSETQVVIGNWNGVSRTFTEAPMTQIPRPNAVRVIGWREDIPLYFAHILGTSTGRVQKPAIAVLGGGRCSGIWGLEGITGNGNIVTDSYNSQEGLYGSAGVYSNGDLCSCADIVLSGDASIHGDVIYGDDYNLYLEGQAAEIQGVAYEQPCDRLTPPIEMIDASFANDNANIPPTDRGRSAFPSGQWDLYVTGTDNLTLPPGTYYFTSAVVDGQATITTTGPTIIHVSGDATFTGGGFVNTSQNPHDLQIYSEGGTLTLTGGGGFAGAVIAPNSRVVLSGGGEFFGLILGRVIDIDGNATLHVDESLLRVLLAAEPFAPMLVQ